MTQELNARAVLVLHENGQLLYRAGDVRDEDFPTMAALVAAMIAAGKSLGSVANNVLGNPSRFSCDSEAMGLYTVQVEAGYWLATLYDQPLNPGLTRMKIRRYASDFQKLGIEKPQQWELTKMSAPEPKPGAVSSPVRPSGPDHLEKITQNDPGLFANITDEEIDRLFDEAQT